MNLVNVALELEDYAEGTEIDYTHKSNTHKKTLPTYEKQK